MKWGACWGSLLPCIARRTRSHLFFMAHSFNGLARQFLSSQAERSFLFYGLLRPKRFQNKQGEFNESIIEYFRGGGCRVAYRFSGIGNVLLGSSLWPETIQDDPGIFQGFGFACRKSGLV